MPVNFQWDNDEKTLIRYTVSGVWNWNEFHKHMRRSLLWFDQVNHPVEMLIDLRGGDKLPAGAIGHLRSLGAKAHPNSRGRAIILGVDGETQHRLGAVDGTYRDNQRLLRFVGTDEAAHAILEQWQHKS